MEEKKLDFTNNRARKRHPVINFPILVPKASEVLWVQRIINLALIPGEVMEQSILRAITQRVWDNQAIRRSKHGIMKGDPA